MRFVPLNLSLELVLSGFIGRARSGIGWVISIRDISVIRTVGTTVGGRLILQCAFGGIMGTSAVQADRGRYTSDFAFTVLSRVIEALAVSTSHYVEVVIDPMRAGAEMNFITMLEDNGPDLIRNIADGLEKLAIFVTMNGADFESFRGHELTKSLVVNIFEVFKKFNRVIGLIEACYGDVGGFVFEIDNSR